MSTTLRERSLFGGRECPHYLCFLEHQTFSLLTLGLTTMPKTFVSCKTQEFIWMFYGVCEILRSHQLFYTECFRCMLAQNTYPDIRQACRTRGVGSCGWMQTRATSPIKLVCTRNYLNSMS